MSCDSQQAVFVDTAMREDPSVAIVAANLGKCYDVFRRPGDRLKQALLRRSYGRKFWALRDVSFTVRKGEALGVVGHNGAGKSTLLQILAGVLRPSMGEARLRGRVASLLELGSGFLPEFTGRENVFVNGTALGLATKEIEQRLGQIQEFADIGEFFEQPVKTYSSGMFVRLAFAVQACLDPDILIVDEALAVGDVFFQQKCHSHMAELLRKGTSILLVTHDIQAVRKYCSSIILLENGSVVHQGDVEIGLRMYLNCNSRELMGGAAFTSSNSPVEESSLEIGQDVLSHWSSQDSFFDLDRANVIINQSNSVHIAGLALCDCDGNMRRNFSQREVAYFYIDLTVLRDFQQIVVGITLWTADNIPVYCQSSLQVQADVPQKLIKGSRIRMRWSVVLSVARGPYTLTLDVSEYPCWISEKMHEVAPENFWSFGLPLASISKLGPFVVAEPCLGLRFPFMGLVDLETQIMVQCEKAALVCG